jgi:hypothetical protein
MWFNTSEQFNFFRPFQVIVHNASDADIVSVETGLIKGESKDLRQMPIRSGESAVIKPDLKLQGEGAVYLKYTNARGETVEETVCGYTEYLSGRTKLTIGNDGNTVDTDCY